MVWNKLCSNHKLTLVEKAVLKKYKHLATLYEHQYRPESKLDIEKRLSRFDNETIKALLYEFNSTKNALLIDQKKCRTAEEIAERDGAIATIDIIILKLQHILRQNNDFLDNN